MLPDCLLIKLLKTHTHKNTGDRMSISKSRKVSRACGEKEMGFMLFVSDHVGVMALNGMTLAQLSWDGCVDGAAMFNLLHQKSH